MGSLQESLKTEMKASMKSGDKARLGVIRMMLAAIKQREVDERVELSDEQVIVTLDRMLKQRRESVKQFKEAGRLDLAENEEAEIAVIKDFMPQPLTEEEIEAMITDAITDAGAGSIKDMGKVMGLLKAKMQGRADMAVVSAKIKSLLSG